VRISGTDQLEVCFSLFATFSNNSPGAEKTFINLSEKDISELSSGTGGVVLTSSIIGSFSQGNKNELITHVTQDVNRIATKSL
jgi:hypothetical protein